MFEMYIWFCQKWSLWIFLKSIWGANKRLLFLCCSTGPWRSASTSSTTPNGELRNLWSESSYRISRCPPHLSSACSDNLLLGEVVLVLGLNAKLVKPIDLLLLNPFNLLALIFKLLANLATFLEVIQPVLFLDFVVFCDLVPKMARKNKFELIPSNLARK